MAGASRWARACRAGVLAALAATLGACTVLPSVGPSAAQIDEPVLGKGPIQVVAVDDAVARRLLAQRDQALFSETLGPVVPTEESIGTGDTIEVNIWESPPATLFGAGVAPDARGAPSAVRATTLPEQVVDRAGFVNVPFIGRVTAAGRSPKDIEADIVKRLTGKANHPEVLVRRTRNTSSTVTIVGEVATSMRMPLTPAGERLLDALAAAGGVRQPVNKMTIQITRGPRYFTLPLQTVIRDPRQNVPLRAGDVVTAIFQSSSFMALGSTGRNDEIAFETQGISLAQALARAGGLNDARSDPRGVFVFRYEAQTALDWPRQPISLTPDGMVPVVYRIDLKDPASFFVMQNFVINDKDIVYVSNAPAAEFQKFLNLVLSVAYPAATAVQLTR